MNSADSGDYYANSTSSLSSGVSMTGATVSVLYATPLILLVVVILAAS